MPRLFASGAFLALLVGFCAYAAGDGGTATEPPRPVAVSIAGCENVYSVTEDLLSGGVPAGDEAFQALADAGVKTIISVDGAKPDVSAAAKYGLRYVHLPFGYDQLPRQRALELSRAIQDLPGKVYVHCHHGKHRSPAAVAGALVCTQGWTGDRAVAFMKLAGTSRNYSGLYSTVHEMKPASNDELATADASFPSIAKVPDFVEMMVQLEGLFDQLTESRKESWQPPKSSPDLVPPNTALQILELFKESRRLGQSKSVGPDFATWLDQAELGASGLEGALRTNNDEAAESSYGQLERSCKDCHEKYRNILK